MDRGNAALILRCISAIDRFTDVLGRTIAWLTFVMAVVTVSIVVLRYAFNEGAILLQESVIYMHALVIALGIPYALKANQHVRVDLVYARLSERKRTLIDLVGHLVFLIPVCIFIVYFSTGYAVNAWQVLEGSPEVGGIPGVFLLKTLIPLFAVILLVQGVAETARGILRIREDNTRRGR